MTFFLGCDVCRTKIDITLINEAGGQLWSDCVTNDANALLNYLLTLRGNYPDDELRIVVESTSRYHYPLLDVTNAIGMPCLLYNPILTKQHIKASVRGKKTDKADALHIARIGLRGDIPLYIPEPYRSVKHYVRGQQKLAELSASLKLHEAHLQAVLEDELSQVAKDMLAGIQSQIKAAKQQFVEDTIAIAPADLIQRLRSIPGIGPFVAASLIAEIQDMQRFTNAKAIIAFAGLDPKVKQSGHSLNSTGRLTKRGSSHLRRSVFIAANVARRCDPYFKAIYDKKRTEGKKHTVAVVIVARKLLTVTRAVWLSETNYSTSFWAKV